MAEAETPEPDPPHLDWAGQEIKVGDYVVYTTSAGRSAVMKAGLVTRLEIRPKDEWRYPRKKVATIRCITIDPWLEDRPWRDPTDGLQKKGKEVALGMLDRVLVVTKIEAVREKFDRVRAKALAALAEKAKK